MFYDFVQVFELFKIIDLEISFLLLFCQNIELKQQKLYSI